MKPPLVSLSLAPLARPLVDVPLATVTPVLKSTLPEELAEAEAEALGLAEASADLLSAGSEALPDFSPEARVLAACPPCAGREDDAVPDEPPEPPVPLRNNVTAPQASAGTMTMIASSGTQLRHRGT